MTEVELLVATEVSRLTRSPAESVDLTRSAVENGVDSLALLVLREALERSAGVHIPDDDWLDFQSLRDVIAFLERSAAEAGPVASSTPARPVDEVESRRSVAGGSYLDADGRLHDVIEVGMPMTGRNGLSENALLKWLGHLRWTHLSAICGVPSKDVRDADEHRLYPTFFYVDLHFPESRHMATFQENDWLTAVCTLERFGSSMLDGLMYLQPAEQASGSVTFADAEQAVTAGVPVARLSNIFVKQFGGAEWLKKSRPANPGFERLAEAVVPPDSYAAVKAAEQSGAFADPPAGFVEITEGWATAEYRIVPDRDLNGAGLLYFANYPLFVDICEREVLRTARFPFTDAFLDSRSLIRRRSAYLNNASSTDTLMLEFRIWVEHPVAAGRPDGVAAPVRLFTNSRMRRRSDGRLMMVSTAEKLLSRCSFGDLPFHQSILDATIDRR